MIDKLEVAMRYGVIIEDCEDCVFDNLKVLGPMEIGVDMRNSRSTSFINGPYIDLRVGAGSPSGFNFIKFEEPFYQFVDSSVQHGITVPQERVSRNGPCPCKSGKKYKRCHGK